MRLEKVKLRVRNKSDFRGDGRSAKSAADNSIVVRETDDTALAWLQVHLSLYFTIILNSKKP